MEPPEPPRPGGQDAEDDRDEQGHRREPRRAHARGAAERIPTLDAVAELARAAGADAIAADARALAARLAEGRFYVACVGQFKRGKSTLLGALVGDAILPAGVLPVTAVATVVRHGAERSVRVQLAEGWRAIPPASLAEWVAEAENPGNAKGVVAVEVTVPSPLLATGMCLVDTPGVGSVFAQNSAATRAFVPHVDAALVVLGADPPISGEELALVAEVGRHVEQLVFVLNKADRLAPEENVEAARFATRILEARLGRPVGRIHEVSATERLAGSGPPRDWDALVEALERLAREAGAGLLEAAEARGIRRLLDRLTAEVAEQRAAFERPQEESEQRIAALRRAVDDAERALGDLSHLLLAEAERMEQAFADRRAELVTRPLPALARLDGRAATFAAARRAARATIDAWRHDTQPYAEELYRRTAARFVELANGLLGRLAAVPGLEGLPRDVPPEAGFRARAAFYFNELLHVADPGLGRILLDWMSPRRGGIARDARRYLARLIDTNSARAVNDLRERALESRRRLEADIRSRLRELVTSAVRALERARALQAAGAGTTAAAREYLASLERRVAALRADAAR